MAMFPLALLIFFMQVVLLSLPLEIFFRFLVGCVLVFLGLVLFLLGARIGLLPMGEAVGAELPRRGLYLLIIFSFLVGFAVTVAEPGVWVLANQVDYVSGGEIGSAILIVMVALGVGVFLVLAMLRILLGIPIAYLFMGGYLLIFILSYFTPDAFVPVAFDAGGVTTGPMTVPFILSLGVGTVSVLGGKSSLADGFGLVGLASIGPVLAVMLLGVIYS